MKIHQKGIGLMEVLVSLFVLAIGVLGFSALQMRALDASAEAMSKLQAMNLAKDLSERIRANPAAYELYASKLNSSTQPNSIKSCIQTTATQPCESVDEFVSFDVSEVIKVSQAKGMKIKMPNCQVVASGQNRRCIYIAWDDTQPIDHATDSSACTNGGSYLPQAKCVVMELY